MDVTSFAVEHAGRRVEAFRAGPQGSTALVFHSGTPNAGLLLPTLVEAAERHGLGTVTFSRPGYAGSTAAPGRSVGDIPAITATVLDHLGVDRFYTSGWSGGGPHALADAAVLGERCIAGVTLAGVAPMTADIDWLAGMAGENIEEFSLSTKGEDALAPFLEQFAGALAGISGADVAESLGGLVSEVDRAALTGEFAEMMATAMRAAVSTGIAGWRDDDLAFVKPWGFEVQAIARPVAVWQGAQDRMVPFAHGEWLAANIPGAIARLRDGDGHLSLIQHVPAIVDELVTLA